MVPSPVTSSNGRVRRRSQNPRSPENRTCRKRKTCPTPRSSALQTRTSPRLKSSCKRRARRAKRITRPLQMPRHSTTRATNQAPQVASNRISISRSTIHSIRPTRPTIITEKLWRWPRSQMLSLSGSTSIRIVMMRGIQRESQA